MKTWSRLVVAAIGSATVALAGVAVASGGAPHPAVNTAGPQAAQIVPAATTPTPSPEAVFTAISPCRIADTNGGGGNIPANSSRGFVVRGTTGFAPQGGKAGGCGIPASATSVALSITTASAVADGWIDAWPSGTPEPLSTVAQIYHDRHTSGTSTIALGAAGTSADIALGVHNASARVVLDVLGYSAPQIHATIAPDGTIYSGTTRVLSATKNSTGAYTVTVDRNVSYCSVSIDIRGGAYYGDGFGTGTSVSISTWSLSSTATAVATNLYFDLTVTC